MTTAKSVRAQVAAIIRKHLESKFGDRLVFGDIRVIPRLDQWGDEYLHIYTIFDGDGELLDPHWINGLYWLMRPELIEMGIASIPTESYIEKSEYDLWFKSYIDKTESGLRSEIVQATPYDVGNQ